MIDFRRILTCALCFHTVKREKERHKDLERGLGGEMQAGRSKAQKDKPEGPSHTLEPGWACSCSLLPRRSSEDPLKRPPTFPWGRRELQ